MKLVNKFQLLRKIASSPAFGGRYSARKHAEAAPAFGGRYSARKHTEAAFADGSMLKPPSAVATVHGSMLKPPSVVATARGSLRWSLQRAEAFGGRYSALQPSAASAVTTVHGSILQSLQPPSARYSARKHSAVATVRGSPRKPSATLRKRTETIYKYFF